MSSIHITSIHPSVRPSIVNHIKLFTSPVLSCPVLSCPVLSSPLLSLTTRSPPPPYPWILVSSLFKPLPISLLLSPFSYPPLSSPSPSSTPPVSISISVYITFKPSSIFTRPSFLSHVYFTFLTTVAPVLLSTCSPDHSAYIFSTFHSKSLLFTIY